MSLESVDELAFQVKHRPRHFVNKNEAMSETLSKWYDVMTSTILACSPLLCTILRVVGVVVKDSIKYQGVNNHSGGLLITPAGANLTSRKLVLIE